jgi:hypothetical protein
MISARLRPEMDLVCTDSIHTADPDGREVYGVSLQPLDC